MVKLRSKPWLWLLMAWGRKPNRNPNPNPRPIIGALTLEISRLMSKTINLWQSLADDRIAVLREETLRLPGLRKLVSDDDEFLLSLALAETMDSVNALARSVARLGARCADPVLQRFDHVFADLIKNDSDLCGLEYATEKRMNHEVRKMERFVASAACLYQELEMLAEVENDVRRMEAIPDLRRRGCNIGDFKKRVSWQKRAVKRLQDVSVWNRSYDFVARILARALFTIVSRIKLVFGFHHKDSSPGPKTTWQFSGIYYSVTALLPSSLHYPESSIRTFASGPLTNNNGVSGKRDLRRVFRRKTPMNRRNSVSEWSVSDGNLMGFMSEDNHVGVISNDESEGDRSDLQMTVLNTNLSLAVFESRRKLLNAPPLTLGAAAFALHYANLIIAIEKLAESPNLIGPDVRDDLYNMLPRSIRFALRIRLRSYAKNLSSSVYDPVLAEEWGEAMSRILEWLSPLAHNMIKWQSDRNFEKQHFVSTTNVLLLQTLYYANQGKTEAAITELLVGLNYLWRYGREVNARALHNTLGSRTAAVAGGRRRRRE